MLTIGCQHVPTNLVFTYTARVGGMVIVIVVSRVTCTYTAQNRPLGNVVTPNGCPSKWLCIFFILTLALRDSKFGHASQKMHFDLLTFYHKNTCYLRYFPVNFLVAFEESYLSFL
jgi:hypothetical protein